MSSGTVALKLGRKAIGIELNASYIEMSMKRFEQPYLEI